MKPKFEDHKPLYEDIYGRIEHEHNNDILLLIKKGLKELRPQSLAKNNKHYWNKVENLT